MPVLESSIQLLPPPFCMRHSLDVDRGPVGDGAHKSSLAFRVASEAAASLDPVCILGAHRRSPERSDGPSRGYQSAADVLTNLTFLYGKRGHGEDATSIAQRVAASTAQHKAFPGSERF